MSLDLSLIWKALYFILISKKFMQDRDVSLHKAKTLSKALHHQLMAPLPKQPVYACKSQSLFGQKHPKGLWSMMIS